jgi:glycosyltransferase involved in cell wall biosynthesis
VIVVARPFVELAETRLGVPRSRVVVVENGVDLAAFAPSEEKRARARALLGIGESEIAVGCIARFVDRAEDKGQPDLVRAVRLAKGRFTVHFVGDGPSLESVRALAAGEPRVVFHGEKREPVHHAFDALVLASHSEGCPYVVLEALAADVPVVATAVGGVPDLLGEAGSLVPPLDPPGLAQALESVVNDAPRRRALSESGLARVRERYSLEGFGRETARVYRQVVAQLGKTPGP